MEPGSSLPHLQAPATFSYPQPDPFSLCLPIPLLEDPFLILSYHVCLGLPSGLFPSGLCSKTFIHPICAVLFNQILIPPPTPSPCLISPSREHVNTSSTLILGGAFILRPGILLLRVSGFCYDTPESENSVVCVEFCVCVWS